MYSAHLVTDKGSYGIPSDEEYLRTNPNFRHASSHGSLRNSASDVSHFAARKRRACSCVIRFVLLPSILATIFALGEGHTV